MAASQGAMSSRGVTAWSSSRSVGRSSTTSNRASRRRSSRPTNPTSRRRSPTTTSARTSSKGSARLLGGAALRQDGPVKISAIRTYPVRVGNALPTGDRPEFTWQLVLKVETDAGIFGLGEAGLSGRERAVIGAVDHLREMLVGRDPTAIGGLWQEMYRSTYFEGDRTLTAAISAIDIALYDIKGKAFGVPVYELLG